MQDAIKMAQKVIAAVPGARIGDDLPSNGRATSSYRVRPMHCPAAADQRTFTAKLGGDLPGVREYLEALSIHVFRATGVGRDRAARPQALGCIDARVACVSLDRDGLIKYFTLLRDE